LQHDPEWYVGEARRQMVEQRHLVVRSLAAGHSREQMEAHLEMIVKIQRAIDVIDRMSRERDGIGNDEANGRPAPRIIGSSLRDGAVLP
jgi:hypothetical protein